MTDSQHTQEQPEVPNQTQSPQADTPSVNASQEGNRIHPAAPPPAQQQPPSVGPEAQRPRGEVTIDLEEAYTPAPTPPTYSPAIRTDGEIQASNEGEIKSGKLVGKGLYASIFILSWPVLIEVLLNTLVGLVDTLFAASISVAVTDGVAAGTFALFLLMLVGMALGSGIFALISRAIGKGRLGMANTVVGQAILLALLIGAVTCMVGLIFPSALAYTMGARDDALVYAAGYLRFVALGMPGLMLLACGYACMRGAGDSLWPMIINGTVNVINLVASYLLCGGDVFGIPNPSPLDMGAAGIGLGTCIAWTCGGLILFFKLRVGVQGLRLLRKRLIPDIRVIRRLFSISWPALTEQVGLWMSNMMLLWMVTTIAAASVDQQGILGAHLITLRAAAFIFMPGVAIGTAAATLAGQYLGAGSPTRAHKSTMACIWVAIAVMLISTIVITVFSNQLIGLISNQPEHVSLAGPALMTYAFCGPVLAITIILAFSLRGAGDTKATMIIQMYTFMIMRPIYCWFCSGIELSLPAWAPFGLGGVVIPNPGLMQKIGVSPFVGIWMGVLIDDLTRFIPLLWWYRKGKWKTIKP